MRLPVLALWLAACGTVTAASPARPPVTPAPAAASSALPEAPAAPAPRAFSREAAWSCSARASTPAFTRIADDVERAWPLAGSRFLVVSATGRVRIEPGGRAVSVPRAHVAIRVRADGAYAAVVHEGATDIGAVSLVRTADAQVVATVEGGASPVFAADGSLVLRHDERVLRIDEGGRVEPLGPPQPGLGCPPRLFGATHEGCERFSELAAAHLDEGHIVVKEISPRGQVVAVSRLDLRDARREELWDLASEWSAQIAFAPDGRRACLTLRQREQGTRVACGVLGEPRVELALDGYFDDRSPVLAWVDDTTWLAGGVGVADVEHWTLRPLALEGPFEARVASFGDGRHALAMARRPTVLDLEGQTCVELEDEGAIVRPAGASEGRLFVVRRPPGARPVPGASGLYALELR